MNHDEFYSKAYFYDVAFRFKDIHMENKTLIDLYQMITGKPPMSFLDIAAGPASNAINMSKQGLASLVIDASKEMVEYGMIRAQENNVALTYLQADMRNFKLPYPVDLAALFMASTGYLLTNEDMVQHLVTVAKNLNTNGLYIIEMIHPRDVFAVGKSTCTTWTESDGDVHVAVQWGDENDPYDPITQTRTVTAHLNYQTPNESGEIVDQCKQREYTFQEMKALIELSGAFTSPFQI